MALQQVTAEGLSKQEAAARLDKYGYNELTPPPKATFLMKLFLQVNNILIYILIAATILSAILEEWKEVALICAVVVINVSIGLVQEGKAEKAADAIKNMLAPNSMVIREGNQFEIPAKELVPGDVVALKAGDQVPADVRLFEVARLSCLEAMLTGESNPINKNITPVAGDAALGDRKDLAFSATMVMDGDGKGIVIGTGDFAEIGRISTMVGTVDTMKTNLMVQLEIFGRWISVFVFIIAFAAFMLAHFAHDQTVGDAFKSAVSIAVAIIPEGLPAVVTISLALAMQLMARNNAIIRQLPAIETLGSITTICSDKTGTLTKNEMTVQKIQTAKSLYDVTGVGYMPDGIIQDEQGTVVGKEGVETMRQMLEGSILCNSSGLNFDGKLYTAVGYPTEVSLLTLGLKMGIPDIQGLKTFKESKPRVNGVPFASEHKFMCGVHAESTAPGAATIIHVKGAPDRLIPKCSKQAVDNSMTQTAPMNEAFWQEAARKLASKGLRTLAVCRAEWPASRRNEEMDASVILNASPFLTMMGIVGILDPPRPEAIEAIKVAHDAGIVVKMITGDHPETAIAIGKMLGIVDPAAAHVRAYTGPEMDKMDDEQLKGIVLDTNIFARASPENKISIVKALQKKDQITSMTGDGVNDAPALKAANIGVAMGITGTDVSKEAAKMVLADDNFATIVAAVKEGRRVWDNLVKILLYNMPVNLAQGLSVFFAYVIDLEAVPLTAMQVLYVNMITSVTMGLMLAMEPAESDIMARPPRRKGKRLFGKLVMWHCVFVTAVIVTLVIAGFAWNLRDNPKDERRVSAVTDDPRINEARAEAFNVLVFCEIAYALNCRFVKHTSINVKLITGNMWCWVAIAVTSILQIFLTYTPGVNDVFNNAPIHGASWARIAVAFLITFFSVELMKAFGPKLLLPIVQPILNCLCPLQGPDRTDAETYEHITFVATAPSTFGVPVNRQSHNIVPTHGTNQPVDSHARVTFNEKPKTQVRDVPLQLPGNDFPSGSSVQQAPYPMNGMGMPQMGGMGMAPQMMSMQPPMGGFGGMPMGMPGGMPGGMHGGTPFPNAMPIYASSPQMVFLQ